MQKFTDNRDSRGKKHELAFVLCSFLYSLLRVPGTLNVAKIHRMMKREYQQLSMDLSVTVHSCISDTQLRRVLSKLDYQAYNTINQEYFGINIQHNQQGWYAIDGKELRGSIDGVSGQKRGENIVRSVCHESKTSQVIGYYQGNKESEKTVVSSYFTTHHQLKGRYSLDALHTSVDLLKSIASKSGIYLAQVKNNQKYLLEDCKQIHQNWTCQWHHQEWEKAHGRQEVRKGFCYQVPAQWFGDKWQATQMKTVIVVERTRLRTKNKQESQETAFFVSNLSLDEQTGMELFQAVRNHWAIEADHYVRDVGFGEDKLKCFESNRCRALAAILNTAMNIIRSKNMLDSITLFREEMCYHRQQAINCFNI